MEYHRIQVMPKTAMVTLTMPKSQKSTKVIFHYTTPPSKKKKKPTRKPGSLYTIYMSRLWENTGKFRNVTLPIKHTVFNKISTLRQKYCTAYRNTGFEMIRLDSTVHLNRYLSLPEHNPSSPTPDSNSQATSLNHGISFH